MAAIKKWGGNHFVLSDTDLIFAYYTWCKVAANAAADPDLNLTRRGFDSGADVEYRIYNHPDNLKKAIHSARMYAPFDRPRITSGSYLTIQTNCRPLN